MEGPCAKRARVGRGKKDRSFVPNSDRRSVDADNGSQAA